MGQHSNCSFEMKRAAVTKYPKVRCSTESIDRSLGQMLMVNKEAPNKTNIRTAARAIP